MGSIHCIAAQRERKRVREMEKTWRHVHWGRDRQECCGLEDINAEKLCLSEMRGTHHRSATFIVQDCLTSAFLGKKNNFISSKHHCSSKLRPGGLLCFCLFWSFRSCILDSILRLHKCLVRAYYAGLLDCWHLWPQSPIFDIFWLLILSFQPNPISKAPVCLLACGCLCADLQHFTLHRPWNKMDTVCKPLSWASLNSLPKSQTKKPRHTCSHSAVSGMKLTPHALSKWHFRTASAAGCCTRT